MYVPLVVVTYPMHGWNEPEENKENIRRQKPCWRVEHGWMDGAENDGRKAMPLIST